MLLFLASNTLERRFVQRLDVHEAPGISIALHVVPGRRLRLTAIAHCADAVAIPVGLVLRHSIPQRLITSTLSNHFDDVKHSIVFYYIRISGMISS